MHFFQRISKQTQRGNAFAKSFWKPTHNEIDALKSHRYVDQLSRVDQIWPWLQEHHGEVIAVDAPHATHPERFTYSQVASQISSFAAAIRDFGINPGDVVALFAENSPRWLIADQGIMRSGAANAVRGASAPIEELRYILEDSKAVALIIQSAELWRKLSLSDAQRKRFKFILQLEGEPIGEGVLGWETLFFDGAKNPSAELLNGRGFDSTTSTIATILYTSGTTGKPKGVPLTHANLLHQIKALACVAHPSAGSPVLSVLPIWHSYERSAEYYFFSCACSQSYTTIKKLKNDLPQVRPVVMATVPRLWEAVQMGFEDAVKRMPILRQYVLRSALGNSRSYKLALRTTRSLLIEEVNISRRVLAFLETLLRWPLHALASLLLWPKVLRQLSGGNLVFPINGGGAIAPHVDLFFEAIGMNLLVGYGLTETSPVVSCRRAWRNIRGSSGQPLPDTEFQIVDQETGDLKDYFQRGLVMVRGPQVMSGYLGRPDATSKVLDNQGWFNTGDLGMLLPDGSIVLTGRAKDTIVLSNGENIEPGPLEEILVASPLFEQVMLVGQDEKQLGILVVPQLEMVLLWAQRKGLQLLDDLGGSPGDETLRRMLRSEINELLARRTASRSDERVVGVALVKPFSIENGLLTQTLKQRRDKIVERDVELIASIYGR